MATMLHWSPERKARELRRQKYPKEGAPQFQIPYYSPARTGIRRYYRDGNSLSALADARSKIESIATESKRDNNKRVIDSFERNRDQLDRKLKIQTNTTYVGTISRVQLRVSPDLRASENGVDRHIFYHWKNAALPGRFAEDALQIAYWVLEQSGINVPITNLEFIDLFASRVYTIRSKSAATDSLLLANARAINDIWPTL